MNEMSGFIKLHRSFKNWEWYANLPTKTIYLHLILCANYKPDTWHNQALSTGQLITSRKSLSTATGLSEQQVRTALMHLEKTGYITIKTTNNYSIITVNHWEIYQNDGANSTYRATDQTPTDSPADQPQLNNINNTKNIEVKNSYSVQDAPCPEEEKPSFYTKDGSIDYAKLMAYSRENIRRRIAETATKDFL